MLVQIVVIVKVWSASQLHSLFTLTVVKVSSQSIMCISKQKKDKGMALCLDEINLPKIYRPTLKPK